MATIKPQLALHQGTDHLIGFIPDDQVEGMSADRLFESATLRSFAFWETAT